MQRGHSPFSVPVSYTHLDVYKRQTYDQILAVLRTPDEQLEELLALAHEVRMRFMGPDVEVGGIISLQAGGCPQDCHFCSQSGQFTSPVRSVWLNIPELVRAAKLTRDTGASEFCIVAAAVSYTHLAPLPRQPWRVGLSQLGCPTRWPPSWSSSCLLYTSRCV